MNTSAKDNKIVNKHSPDPFDRLIFEKGIRARQIIVDKKLNLLIVLLNNGAILKTRLSSYPRLKKASQKQLNNWELSGGGIGIRWHSLDEDLFIKGLIKESTLNAIEYQTF